MSRITAKLSPKLSKEYQNSLDWLMQVAYTTFRLFNKNGLQNHAAATAFYFLLSATPLLLMLSYSTQWLASLAENSAWASILLAALYDQFQLESLTQMGLIPQRAQAGASGVGFLTLLLASRGLLNAMNGAFKVIFPSDVDRKFVLSWTLPLLIIPIIFATVGITVVSQAGLNFLLENDMLGEVRVYLFKAANFLITFGIAWLLIFAAYWRLPLQAPPARTAAIIAVLSALSFFLLFFSFAHFFKLESYKSLYGALGSVVFVLIGAYITCLLFYLWAQWLFSLARVDVTALEQLFLGGGNPGTHEGKSAGANRLESYVFGRSNRLIDKYGQFFQPGETIIEEGDDSQMTYFLYSGQAGVYFGQGEIRKRVSVFEGGQLFGEMAYLLGEKRSATIQAETEVVTLALPPNIFEELMRHSAPLSRRIIGSLCLRLQKMNIAVHKAPG